MVATLASAAARLAFVAIAVVASLVGTYPPTPRGSAVNVYFGTRVPDPYRWLEQTQSPQTRRWVGQQTALTERVLRGMPDRSAFRSQVLRIMGARHDDLPQVGGDVSAFMRSDGDGRVPYVVLSLRDSQRVIIDPNRRWPDGKTSLVDWQLSPDGRLVAYATKRGGLGLVRWHVLDVATRRDRTDLIVGAPDWAPIAWAANGGGFYYGGYPSERLAPPGKPIGTGYSVRFHRIGRRQADDRLVFARADRPTWLPYAGQSSDGRYEIVGAIDGSSAGTLLAIRDLRSPREPLRTIRTQRYDYVANAGAVCYFFTKVAAARGRLVAIDLREPARDRTVISPRSDTLEDVTAAGDRFVARYLRDDESRLVAYDRRGAIRGRFRCPAPAALQRCAATSAVPRRTFSFRARLHRP